MTNPLQKYFRQPKIYIQLPSKGIYYESGTLTGDWSNVPIFAMTGMDEILMKTPDALFTGESTCKVIESCCPYIKNAKTMPSIDVEALLIAIRIATFGPKLSLSQRCPKCGTENDYDIDLSLLLDHFNNLKYINTVKVLDDLTIRVRPLQYEETNYFSIENFKLQKILVQAVELKEEEKQKQIDKLYADLSELQLQLFLTTIENVQAEGINVTEKAHIEEWLRNADREIYKQIKAKLEENKESWNMPDQHVKCANCEADNKLAIVMDQANFFG